MRSVSFKSPRSPTATGGGGGGPGAGWALPAVNGGWGEAGTGWRLPGAGQYGDGGVDVGPLADIFRTFLFRT